MDTLFQDSRQALRLLTRHPGFTAVAVLTMALGIGVNTAVFTVCQTILVKPLPFANPDRLVQLVTTHAGLDVDRISYEEIRDYQADVDAFEGVTSYFRQPEDRFDQEALQRFVSIPVLPNFFTTLGVDANLGRTFLPEETSESHVVVLSHGFWHRRFGGNPSVIGQTLRFDGSVYTVVGVMPPAFEHVDGLPADVWTPLWPMSSRTARRDTAIARLRQGVSRAQAQAQVDIMSSALERAHPDSNAGWRVRLVPLHDTVVGAVRGPLLILLVGVGFVLAIACVNVGNMLLSRNLSRRGEIGIRAALGAGSARLIRQFLTESLFLAVPGGVAGTLLAFASVKLLLMVAPSTLPRLVGVSMDVRVWLWLVGLTLLVGIVLGLAPALAVGSRGRIGGLQSLHPSTRDRATRHLRTAFLVLEVALAVVLLVGSALMVKSLIQLRRIDLGFRPQNVVTVYLRPEWGISRDGPNMAVFYQDLRERLGKLPGVLAVGAAKGLPLTQYRQLFETRIAARGGQASEEPVTADQWWVVPGYFEALGIPLRGGRYFEAADDIETRHVAIISERLADRVFPGRDPIGDRLSIPGSPQATIVGVVGDVRTSPTSAPRPSLYMTGSNASARLTINLAIRIAGDPIVAGPMIRNEIGATPHVAILDMSTLDEALEQSIGYPRFMASLLNGFGLVGLLLAAIGIYGVTSYAVVQRQHEIGVRMALGADRGAIMRLIVSHGLRVACAGTVIGTLAALLTTRFLSTILSGLSPMDPAAFAVATMTALAAAGLATSVPASRAARLDASRLLKSE